MAKLDLKKSLKSYYTAGSTPEIVNLPRAQYISIAGKGDPDGDTFKEHISLLYPVAYHIKFKYKALDKDFVVPPLEGQWWFDENKYALVLMKDAPTEIPRSEWEYRLMIRMPVFVNKEAFEIALKETANKKALKGLEKLKWFEMEEGKSLQILHKGPFQTEPESLEKLTRYMLEHDLKRSGLHHEIYLSDFRKTAAEKLKTILREPVI